MVGEVTDNDVLISLDDQKMINRFARQNQKLEEIKDELKVTSEDFLDLYLYCFRLHQLRLILLRTALQMWRSWPSLLRRESPFHTWWGSSLLWKILIKYRHYSKKESKFFPSSLEFRLWISTCIEFWPDSLSPQGHPAGEDEGAGGWSLHCQGCHGWPQNCSLCQVWRSYQPRMWPMRWKINPIVEFVLEKMMPMEALRDKFCECLFVFLFGGKT